MNGSTLVLTYNEPLDGGSTPAAGDFVVTAAGSTVNVTGVGVAGSTVTLTLATAVEANQAVTLAYALGANPIQDAAGNDADSAALTPPALTGATVNSSTLVLTYRRSTAGRVPA